MPRLLSRLGISVFRILTRPLTTAAPLLPHGLEFRIFPPEELIAHCADPGLELSEKTARAAFERGEVCDGALHNGRLVAYAWFAYEAAPHVEGIWMQCDRRAIYIYRAFVHPEHRGRGIAPALYRFGDGHFIRDGRRFAVVGIEGHNRASIAAAEESGARTVGRAGYLLARGQFLAARSPGAASVGFRFYRP